MGLIAALAACATLCVPAAASAANSFTWGQPGDFNASSEFGVQSWSYSPSTFSSSFAGDGGP
jgi:hypothetical protein